MLYRKVNGAIYVGIFAVGRIIKCWNKLKDVKGNLRSKKSLAQMKEREKCQKKRAITDLNAPNGSRDIPFQSQEFEQY